ncbi:alpha/beta hydrolase family protein [Pseudomonas fragi]|uniref:alpha/beta hydrolase family protein n=1 Tax=Pseudomonas fragi TaxID=296 RepID=UPI000BA226BA|nr:alpha/beta hydrolase family protein [Pseudomonas fragi]PAA19193.1 hydrolase or acyltransferase [Pseudomonas fragi]
MFSYRLALPALCLSLILPFALPVLAADTKPQVEPEPAVRAPLPERSQEDAAALERQLPQHEQQQLQAPNDSFLALWKPANSSAPEGAVIIIPGAGETADWPLTVSPLRNKLPDANWASLSLSLPDMQSEASQPREAEPEKPPAAIATDSSSKAATTTAKPIEQAASDGTESTEPEAAQTGQDLDKADAERIFARIDAAIAFAQHQNMRTIVLLGHGSGAYWASRYISTKHPAQIQKLIMVSARKPVLAEPDLSQLTPALNVALLDIFYKDQPLAREAALQRLQASKRANGSNFKQVGLFATPGNRDGDQEQLFRRVRGWLSPQPVDK